jgi:hypothetical protein
MIMIFFDVFIFHNIANTPLPLPMKHNHRFAIAILNLTYTLHIEFLIVRLAVMNNLGRGES